MSASPQIYSLPRLSIIIKKEKKDWNTKRWMKIRWILGFLISYETGNPNRLWFYFKIKFWFSLYYIWSSYIHYCLFHWKTLKFYGPSVSEDGEVLPFRTYGRGRGPNRSVKGLILDRRDRKMFTSVKLKAKPL